MYHILITSKYSNLAQGSFGPWDRQYELNISSVSKANSILLSSPIQPTKLLKYFEAQKFYAFCHRMHTVVVYAIYDG